MAVAAAIRRDVSRSARARIGRADVARLAAVYRRLEMRGEIRGGRFVGGVGGEQFALPEAVERLRKHRDQPAAEVWSVISAVDPLNLVGIVTRDARVPAVRGNRIVLLNGRPIAAREARAIRWLVEVDDATRQRAERLLTAPGAIRRNAVANRSVSDDGGMNSFAGAAGSDPSVLTRGMSEVSGRQVVPASTRKVSRLRVLE